MSYKANSSIPLNRIKISDEFFEKYRKLVGKVIIPYQWEVLNDRLADVETSHAIENFRIAAGLSDGEFQGMVFQDTDLAKWLEAVGFYISSFGRDEELEKLADEAIELIGKAQREDGYLDTYYIITSPEKKWSDLEEGHELYTAGHMIEAAVAYYEATGKEHFLHIVTKLAELLTQVFGEEEGKIHGYPGHPEVELALVKLYRVTGRKEFFELAKYFINTRGVGENYFLMEEKRPGFVHLFPEFNNYDPSYSQSHLPVRKQLTAEGHAVRACYLYSAMTDIAAEEKDEELLKVCKTIWENIVNKRMYITGSIGSSGWLERFTTDYDLPNDSNYSETCASIGLAMFGKRMAETTGEAQYIDIVERALYNTILSGIGMDGKRFFYVNPLEVWPASCMEHTSKAHVKAERQTWFGVACCPPNIARTLASLGQYIYFLKEDTLYINLYISGEIQFPEGFFHVESKMPWEGETRVKITGTVPFSRLAFRIPGYADNFTVQKEDGDNISGEIYKGYFKIDLRKEKPDSFETELRISFPMPAKIVRSHPQVRANAGKVALMKGPVVYCLEEEDNGENLSALSLCSKYSVGEEYHPEILGGTVVLKAKGKRLIESGLEGGVLYGDYPQEYEDVELTAVPYCYWGNRLRRKEMSVWIREMS